jgi:hypothetical protein
VLNDHNRQGTPLQFDSQWSLFNNRCAIERCGLSLFDRPATSCSPWVSLARRPGLQYEFLSFQNFIPAIILHPCSYSSEFPDLVTELDNLSIFCATERKCKGCGGDDIHDALVISAQYTDWQDRALLRGDT